MDLYWPILIVANTPVYLLLGWAVFGSWEGFVDALRYWITPDAWSWLRGEWLEGVWSELKLLLFLAACAAAVVGEHLLIGRLFG